MKGWAWTFTSLELSFLPPVDPTGEIFLHFLSCDARTRNKCAVSRTGRHRHNKKFFPTLFPLKKFPITSQIGKQKSSNSSPFYWKQKVLAMENRRSAFCQTPATSTQMALKSYWPRNGSPYKNTCLSPGSKCFRSVGDVTMLPGRAELECIQTRLSTQLCREARWRHPHLLEEPEI